MNYFSKLSGWACCALSIGAMACQPACASIVMDGTRVIYQGDKNEVTISLTNKNPRPVLIQSWIDTGNEKATPDKISVPFVLTPPINRVDPNQGKPSASATPARQPCLRTGSPCTG
jgi:chaperone protein EcpD